MGNDRLGFFASSAAIALLVTFALSARVWSSETVLFDFSGSDGSQPYGGLISDSTGNLYGTTSVGGASGAGTVFELEYKGGTKYSEKVLHSFTGGNNDGGFPTASLVFDKSFNLYGTTEVGGSGSCGGSGCGVVFEFLRSSNYKMEIVLYRFTGGGDGGLPIASVVLDASGNLYGTTTCGGMSSCAGGTGGAGVVFELVRSRGYQETILYGFTGGSDGGVPIASVIQDASGNLYGTTELGGSGSCAGTASGCGVVFELVSSKGYQETVLYRFTGGSDGGEPFAPVILDTLGNLYGTTTCGGSGSCTGGNGVVFEFVKSGGIYHVLHHFLGNDGAQPTAGLAFDSQDTYLYGTTFAGGISDFGTVFRIQKSGSSFTSLHSFLGGNDGAYPFAGFNPNTKSKGRCTGRCGGGTTIDGGAFSLGIVYSIVLRPTE